MNMNYQLKIKLKDISKPPVWRRLLIPVKATFGELHLAIQAVFGWQMRHLYRFSDKVSDYEWKIGMCDSVDPKMRDAAAIRLEEIIGKDYPNLVYVYDFGDGWVHEITVEACVDKELKFPTCIAGRGTCPPEESGGSMAYEHMKKVFSTNPKGEEAAMFRSWLGLRKNQLLDIDTFYRWEANDDIRNLFNGGTGLLARMPVAVITKIAEEVEAGLIIFLNPDTLEWVSVFNPSYSEWNEEDEDNPWNEEYAKVDKWEHSIKIEQMDSHESFQLMEAFINAPALSRDEIMKSRLAQALSKPKPFRHFKDLVLSSAYREQWYCFSNEIMVDYVRDVILHAQW